MSFLVENPLHLEINLPKAVVLNIFQINNLQMNFISQFLENFKAYKNESIFFI